MAIDLDWKRLLSEQRGEHPGVDFKAPCAWSGADRAKLTADILAMANTSGGGLLVIGVAENDAKRHEVKGLDDEQLRSFDVTVVGDFVGQYAQPQARVTVEKPSVDGHPVVVIRVAEFSETPLIATRALEYVNRAGQSRIAFPAGAVLIRTKAAQTTQIKSAEDMRDLIKRTVAKTKDDLLLGFRQLLEGQARGPVPDRMRHAEQRARWTKSFEPWAEALPHHALIVLSALPDRDLSDTLPTLDRVKELLRATDSYEVGWEFLAMRYAKETNLAGAVEGRVGDRRLWQAYRSGAFFSAASMEDHGIDRGLPPDRLWLWRPVNNIALALRFFARYYAELGVDAEIEVGVELAGIKGRRLEDNGQEMILPWREPISHEEKFSTKLVSTVPKLSAGWEIEATNLIERVFEVFNVERGDALARRLVASVPGARKGTGAP